MRAYATLPPYYRALTFGVYFLLFGLLFPVSMLGEAAEVETRIFDSWRDELNARLDRDLAVLRVQAQVDAAPLPEVDHGIANSQLADPTHPVKLQTAHRAQRSEMVDIILRRRGLPPELVSVAAVESGFKSWALSPKGALGLWQLMPDTARRYGLVIRGSRDERLDPIKSTVVAAQYLKDLYGQFGNWPLTLAAYNAGENRVQRAVERFRTHDFWTLSRQAALPEETRRYVPAVLSKVSGRGPLAFEPHAFAGLNQTEPNDGLSFSGPATQPQVVFATSLSTPSVGASSN